MALTCNGLLKSHNDAWDSATRHPFLENCKSGTIEPGQFNTWLVQDYHFVTEFTRMVASVLANAPVSYFDTILGGLAALKDELNWFRKKAQERNLDLNVAMQEANKHYCEFMASLTSESYAVQATAFWAVEVVYNQAWQLPGPMVKPYDEFADRWGNQDFTAYVSILEKQADEALKNSSEEIQKRAEEVFLQIAVFEKSFWQMAYERKQRGLESIIRIKAMEKTKLIEIIKKLLGVDPDLSFLEKLKKSELETLVAYIRDRVDNLGK